MKNLLTLHEESRFEADNHLVARFDNCESAGGGGQRYTAKTESGTLVTYHCDADRCVMDCTAR